MLTIRSGLLLLVASIVTASAAAPSGALATPPRITSISPAIVEAVSVDGLAEITLQGFAFSGVTKVRIDGQVLASFPSQFSIVNDNVMTALVPLPNRVGTVLVEILGANGAARSTIQIVANAQPTVDMLNSDPNFLIQAVGLRANLAGGLGDLLMLRGSLDLIPSVFPGIADFAIGNGGASLINLGSYTIPVTGYAKVNVPLSGLLTGTKLHMQAAALTTASGFAWPATMSNVQTGTILF